MCLPRGDGGCCFTILMLSAAQYFKDQSCKMRVPSVFFSVLILSPGLFGSEVNYDRDIKPLLRTKCAACHGALKQEAGLRLDAARLIRRGGDSGAVIDVDDSANSLLLSRVAAEDPDVRMPPEGEGEKLTQEEILLLRKWIESGAIAPEDETIPPDPSHHWAYQPPVQKPVPQISDAAWRTNPIDAFIAQRHREANLHPVPVADRYTLVRRLYFDLIGLPPSPEQIDAFVEDTSDHGYAALVDQLLNSPHYGERWGRHWMDVWRYSDWNGYKNQLRGSQRHIWRWRDWIIESVNRDRGYDRMIVEMLAGDEIAPDDPGVLRATGFLARNFHKSNRNIWLDATVEHTAKAFLGLTMNCARCHDHKFDPIAQRDYYAMRAIFEPHHVRTERVPGQPNIMKDGLPRAFDSDPDAKTFLYVRGNEKHFDKNAPVPPELPAIFGQKLNAEPVSLPPVAVFPAFWPHVEAEDIRQAEQRVTAAKKQLKETTNTSEEESSPAIAQLKLESARADLASLRARYAADKAKQFSEGESDISELAQSAAEAERKAAITRARFELADSQAKLAESQAKLAAAKTDKKADTQKLQGAAEAAKKAVVAAKKQLASAEAAANSEDVNYTAVGKTFPRRSTGRRLALARWITHPGNPLTARVAVNHIWLRHFGEPLVSNTFDFGLRSPRPQHADLLDWLAVELMEHQWSMKHIHRLIVTSRTWQLQSSADPALTAANARIDPDNRLYWRARVRRLDAEVVRDSVLHVAGSLDLQLGGADIDYAKGETVARRSVYFRHAYEKQMTMLVLFDAAGPNECYRRSESIIPQQALALANSALSVSESRKLARSLTARVQDAEEPDAAFVHNAFRRVLARPPADSEMAACLDFLSQQASVLSSPESLTKVAGKTVSAVGPSADPHLRAKENLVHVLMNHNDFVTLR